MRNICSKILALLAVVSVTGLGASSQAQLLWTVGIDDDGWPAGDGGGANASFVQENGNINPLPGSPISTEVPQGADNDYYFAGSYTTVIDGNGAYAPVGDVAVNEEAAERAFAAADNNLRYHFNLPASLRPFDLLSVTFDANNLDDPGAVNTDPRYGIEVYINGVLVQTQIVIRPAQLGTDYTSPPISLASVGAQTGPGFDNIVSLRGVNYNTEGGGNWMGIDYVQLNATAGVPPQVLTGVVETGGDNEPTDTITAKWTGQTFPISVASEPIPSAVVGNNYTVGAFGNHAPNYVDRNHRYTNASDTVPIPAYLVGRRYIMSGNDNRDNAGYLLDVTVSAPVTAYLLIDNRLGDANNTNPPAFDATHMQWVLDQGWTPSATGANRTGNNSLPDEVAIDEGADGTINNHFSVYKKAFPAGTFQLRQADNTGQNMYGLVVAMREVIIVDTNAPRALAATAGFSPSTIVVRFSERLEPLAAQDFFNYDVPGFVVLTAVLQPNGTNVVLTVDGALEAGRNYSVTVQNVTDVNGNVLDPNPTTIAFSVSSGGGYPATVMAANPIAYWRFNESPPTAINAGSLGAAANGTYNGGATTGSQAPRPPALPGFEPGNTALQLDGVDDFVGTLAGLMNDRPIFTVSGWIRRNAAQADRTGLWGQNDLIEFGYINNNTLEVWTDNGLDIANGIPNEEWAHLAIVSTGNPGTMSMYTNGVLAGERGHTLPANNTFPWNIGGGGVFDAITNNGNYFNGQIDEVAIFATAFSPAQIQAQYRSALEEPGYSFSDCTLPAGTIATPPTPGTPTTAGGPYVGDDGTGNCVLHLTDRFNSLANYWAVPFSTPQKFETINARWRTKIEGVGGADGFSFNVSDNPGTGFTPEEGAGNGLSVCVDTYNNGATPDQGLDIKWNGATLTHLQIGPATDGAGASADLAIGQFVDTSVEVTATGGVTFRYATFVITAQIPNYNGITANQYLFAARTGGANENCWIDDIIFRSTTAAGPVITTGPADQSVSVGQTATFSVVATGTEPLGYQWSRKLASEAAFSPIAGATAASYTTPATAYPADDNSSFKVVVSNADGSTESGVATLRVVPPGSPVTLWTVGRDDDGWPAGDGGGANATFVQENGTINPLPGVPNSPEVDQQADNDYYFAGSYTTVIPANGAYSPVGVVAANEEAAERAFAGADNDLRYHFNLPSTLKPTDLLSVTFDANNLDSPGAVNTDPRYGIEVYINNVLVQTQIVIRPAQLGTDYTSPAVSLASVGAQVGPGFDNIVSLRGINYNAEGGGNWMGIDYVQLDARVIETPPTTTNTPPQFVCGPSQQVNEGVGAQVVPNWATGILPYSIVRNAIVYGSDFSSLPPGASVAGSASITNGVLHLTDAVNSQSGQFFTPAVGVPVESFSLDFKLRIGGGTCCGSPIPEGTSRMADGLSLNIGNDLGAGFGEEGTGTGIIVSFDLWDNGEAGAQDSSFTAPNIDIRRGGTTTATIAYQALDGEREGGRAPSGPIVTDPATSQPMKLITGDAFASVHIKLDADGTMDVDYKGVRVIDNVQTGYLPITGARLGIGARTGGANANQWIDDLQLEAFSTDASSAEAGQTVIFLVSNDHPEYFSVQPAVAPNGTLTYTPAAGRCGLAKVTVRAMDNGGTANGGSDTSAPCTIDLNIICGGGNTPPLITSKDVYTDQGVPVSFTIDAFDPDGDPLTYMLLSQPPAGAGVLTLVSNLVTYTPSASYVGMFMFDFNVCDPFACTFGNNICVTVRPRIANTAPTARIIASPVADFSPNLDHKVLITCNGSNACLELGGAMSSDAESSTHDLSFQWFGEPSLLPLASGMAVSNMLDLGVQTVRLAVTDPQGATGTDTLTVEVLNTDEALGLLLDKVNGANVARKSKRPFLTTLKAATVSLGRGQNQTAAIQLKAFQSKVRAQIGREHPAEAETWLRWSQYVIDALNR